MIMRHAIVYHSADFDGLGCYAVYRDWAEKNGCEVTGYPYNYSEKSKPAAEELMQFDMVFVGDCCLPSDTMKLLAGAGKLIWVDHHITAISLSEKEGFSHVLGLRMVGRGACELTVEVLYPGNEVPKVIQLLSAYDVFDKERFDWDDLVLPFQFGMRNLYNLDAQRFYEDWRDCTLLADTDAILQEGAAILRYLRSTGTRACGLYGFPVTVGGNVRAICLLTANFGSIAMEQFAVANGYDVVINVNRLGSNAYKVSFYTACGDAPINLGKYLHEHYNGGGHWNAAGAVIDRRQFLKLIDKNVI